MKTFLPASKQIILHIALIVFLAMTGHVASARADAALHDVKVRQQSFELVRDTGE